MSDLRDNLTQSGTLIGSINTVVTIDDYNYLDNKPSINGIVLQGNKSSSELGLVTPATEAVRSVNYKTGDIILDGDDIDYDANLSINQKIDAVEASIPSVNYPVTSVNTQTGDVVLDGDDIAYDAINSVNQKIDAVEASIPSVNYPVTSVNTQTGDVVLDGGDIAYDALNSVNQKIDAVEASIPSVNYPVTSVNTQTGDVLLDGDNIAYDALNSVNDMIDSLTDTSITTVTHAKYKTLSNGLTLLVLEAATDNEVLNIPAPTATQYYACVSNSNTPACIGLTTAGKVQILTSGVTSVYGTIVYY